MGGSAYNPKTTTDGAFVMRVDTVSGAARWRKFIESPTEGQFERTTAMAVTPDGSTLAVHVQPISAVYYHKSYILSVRASDGGILSDALKIDHGSVDVAEHALFSEGMVYKDANTLFMTFFQTSPTKRNKGHILAYAGRYYIARVDPLTQTMVWRKEFSRFGYSASLVYKNWGIDTGNLLIGGAVDYTKWPSESDNENWRLGIFRITEAGSEPTAGDSFSYLE